MRVVETGICGAYVIEPSPRLDSRGRFVRAWCAREFAQLGLAFAPVQSNLIFSSEKGTLRGMHYQVAPSLEAKLVRCTRGSLYDVVLDLRPGSKSYGEWRAVELTAGNAKMLLIPEHCAHGCQSLESDTEILYMASASYDASAARGVRFDDPTFHVRWPLPPSMISDQDDAWAPFEGSKQLCS
jgi:dTDP-4-dehydrorhamnose 3,5-epimerase